MKIAVLLAGSGVYDGSEITETTSALIHLSRKGAEISCFAPDKDQMHVVNHIKGEPVEGETRNVLQESARIARGAVKPLKDLDVKDFDGIVIPGGFGVAKNLCDFAVKGAEMTVDADVDAVLKGFHGAKKPIALSCISPALAAKSIGNGVKLTMGECGESEDFPYASSIEAIEAMGAKHEETAKPCNTAVVDKENKVVTAAAYMYAGKPHEIYDSLGAMIDGLYELLG